MSTYEPSEHEEEAFPVLDEEDEEIGVVEGGGPAATMSGESPTDEEGHRADADHREL